MNTPRIAVVGAGPAGCMLARLLINANIHVTIFEAEASIDVRSQGGTLDLHDGTGLAAIKAAGLWDEYLKFARFDGAALGVCDKNAKFYLHMGGSKIGSPEIDRVELRALLVRALPSGVVRWGHRLTSVSDDLTLNFENGNKVSGFDLIVGADGAWSKVRNFLTSVKPFYSGIAGHSMSIPDAANTTPAVSKFVNQGSVFAYSDGKTIHGQQMGDGSLHCAAWIRQEQDPRGTIKTPVTKELICQDFEDWSPKLLDFIRKSEGEITARSLYMLPVGDRWTHRSGVTLLGDAAHLMTPFAGEGVNLAFEDAMKLAKAIIPSSRGVQKCSLDAGITVFEQEMFVRSKRAMELTEGMMNDMFFTEDAPRSSIASWITRRLSYDFHPRAAIFVRPVVSTLAHAYYFFYNLFV